MPYDRYLGTDATFVHINGFYHWHQCHFCSRSPDLDEKSNFLIFIHRIQLFLYSFGGKFVGDFNGRSGLTEVDRLRKVVFTNKGKHTLQQQQLPYVLHAKQKKEKKEKVQLRR